MSKPVAVIMGSHSDWQTMQAACGVLDELGVGYHTEIVSAHRTPVKLQQFSQQAERQGFQVIIAGAGGAAHLPGMVAAHTSRPVLGVPINSAHLNGLDSLLSIVQMPRGVAVGTLAIGTAGAFNAGLLAGQILALGDRGLADRVRAWREQRTDEVLTNPDPGKAPGK